MLPNSTRSPASESAKPARSLAPDSWLDPELDPLEVLAVRAPRLADVVEAHSRRRDVRERRSRLLLLLLSLRCPPGSAPRRAWYVPGAVARVSQRSLASQYSRAFPADPLSERRIRDHLAALERGLAIIRSPGDLMPSLTDGPPPRYAETIHVLELDEEARFWSTIGRRTMRRHSETRTSAAAWSRFFRDWRSVAGSQQLELFPDAIEDRALVAPPPAMARTKAATVIRDAVRAGQEVFELLATLRATGCDLRGRRAVLVASNARRLEGASALLAAALERGDSIRNRAGWLVRAFDGAPDAELEGARRAAMRWEPPRPRPAGELPSEHGSQNGDARRARGTDPGQDLGGRGRGGADDARGRTGRRDVLGGRSESDGAPRPGARGSPRRRARDRNTKEIRETSGPVSLFD